MSTNKALFNNESTDNQDKNPEISIYKNGSEEEIKTQIRKSMAEKRMKLQEKLKTIKKETPKNLLNY